MKSFFIISFGCKVNQYESQEISEALCRAGFTRAEDALRADIVIVNSCTVTSESDRKARQALRKIKKDNPSCILVLTGCSSQAAPLTYADFPELDILLGNKTNSQLPQMLSDYLANTKPVNAVVEHKTGDEFIGEGITSFDEHTRAFLKIQDGCDRFCSYCIIPTARGRSRSKALEQISAELTALENNGYSEIVLTGINLSDYGKGTEYDLADAVMLCEAHDGIKRVRLGSLEPDHLTDALINRLSQSKKLCGHFHISLQSGCDKTLKAMNRHYTSDEYLALCNKLRSSFDNCSITTDIMVGFPGETQGDFMQTVEFAREVGFEKIHIFPYSKRQGTRAASMPQITAAQKHLRAAELAHVANEIRRERLAKYKGKILEVLFEAGKDGSYDGYTTGYLPVTVSAPQSITGKILKVYITDSSSEHLIGSLV